MTITGPPEESRRKDARQVPRLPRANALTAIVIAVSSLATAVAILATVQDEAGKAAAGAIATAGLALAGRLGTPSR
ncbi:hypothetical protein PV350_01135 [Streptomyces sp. PA03-6a]|nr:hypothetical protein [Streptomyces sp. PA03-6a]